MNRLKKLFSDFSLRADIINIIIGIVLIVSLIFVFLNPYHRYAILTACLSGGLMNIMNGLKMLRDPKKKTLSMSFVMMGIVLIFLGFYLVNMIKSA